MKKSAKKRSRRKTGQDAGNLFPFYAVSSFIWDLRWNFWGSNLREISAVSKSRYQSPDIGVVPFDAAENASALPQRFPFIGTVHGKEIFCRLDKSDHRLRLPWNSLPEGDHSNNSCRCFLSDTWKFQCTCWFPEKYLLSSPSAECWWNYKSSCGLGHCCRPVVIKPNIGPVQFHFFSAPGSLLLGMQTESPSTVSPLYFGWSFSFGEFFAAPFFTLKHSWKSAAHRGGV